MNWNFSAFALNASGLANAEFQLTNFPLGSDVLASGTTLTTGPGGDWLSETVWNWGNEFGPTSDVIGSSGGISSSYLIPSWRWSGESGWATYQFSVAAGTNVFQWRYTKDAIGSAGVDTAFIDNLDLPQIATTLRLLNPTLGGFQLQFQTPRTQSVRIQGSTDLDSWQDISTIVLSNGAFFQFSDPQAPNYPLYRF
jgi:hypothetical protein